MRTKSLPVLLFAISSVSGCSDDGAPSAHDPEASDAAVVQAVLTDLMSSGRFRGTTAARATKAGIILDTLSPGPSPYLRGEQIDGELNGQQDKVIPHDALIDLVNRNGMKRAWAGPDLTNDRITLLDLDAYALSGSSSTRPYVFEKHPECFAWVQAWRPGYSRDGMTALVRFGIGPTAHFACGTYLLRRDGEGWTVVWGHIASFV